MYLEPWQVTWAAVAEAAQIEMGKLAWQQM